MTRGGAEPRRTGRGLVLALAAGGALLAAAPALAQAPSLDAVCGNASTVDLAAAGLADDDPLRKLHPPAARAALQPFTDEGRWIEAADSIAAWFRATGVREPVFASRLDSLADPLRLVAAGVAPADAFSRSRVDFNVVPAPGRFEIFVGTPPVVVITAARPAREQMALCWAAISAEDLIGRHQAPLLRALHDRLRIALARWRAFNDVGRSQYPWELWINGLRADPVRLEPERWQVIALHPWVGLQLTGLDRASFGDLGSITRAAVVPFDLAGLLRYRDDFTGYWGASAILTFGEDRTRGGLAVHLSNGISFGPTFSRLDAPDGFLFTIDFYEALAGLPFARRVMVERLEAAVADPGA